MLTRHNYDVIYEGNKPNVVRKITFTLNVVQSILIIFSMLEGK
jgi:hypothetical protein